MSAWWWFINLLFTKVVRPNMHGFLLSRFPSSLCMLGYSRFIQNRLQTARVCLFLDMFCNRFYCWNGRVATGSGDERNRSRFSHTIQRQKDQILSNIIGSSYHTGGCSTRQRSDFGALWQTWRWNLPNKEKGWCLLDTETRIQVVQTNQRSSGFVKHSDRSF